MLCIGTDPLRGPFRMPMGPKRPVHGRNSERSREFRCWAAISFIPILQYLNPEMSLERGN